jgi:hypothetical protein
MADEHQARAMVNMAIIGDVDEQFLEDLTLYPAVKDGNDRREVGISIIQVKLYVYMLKVDRRFFFEYGSQVCRSFVAFPERCL